MWTVLHSMRRFWAVVAVGLALTASAAVKVRALPGTYYSQVDVLFLVPAESASANRLLIVTRGLIATAGVVARSVGEAGAQPVSDGVTLVGEGVRRGYSIRLPNSGGQWEQSHDRAQLDLQATGATPQDVRTTMEHLIGRVNADLLARQTALGVRPENLIHTRLSPPAVPVYYSSGSHVRALASTLCLGTGLSLGLAVLLDTVRPRRRRTSAAPQQHVVQLSSA